MQIGDYKLYLKAEGVEQVDDARTMPIERVENGATATESMPAVAVPAPTAPVPVVSPPVAAGTAPPGVIPTPAPGVVGAPSRTLVEMDGSMLQKLREQQQRPIADPAVVAKLSETASYGKFVVLSSNFAGKEFELSRPQMIVGRTDDNGIVINHRSISRNHAKVVRDPDTGRYTISDLQSSNGVRVNGQDYTKVELRRGDTVDLGHVRLRFVEPGEDFVFNASMVTDVPEGGGKRGLMAAVVIAVLLVGAIGVYFAFLRNDGGGGGENNGSNNGNNGSVVTIDAKGSDLAVNPPPVTIDAASVEPPPIAIDATPASTSPTEGDIEARCNELKAKEKWPDLENCAKDLQQFNPDKASGFRKLAKDENGANVLLAKLKTQVQTDQIDNAKKTLDAIDKSSIYRAEAEALYNGAHEKMITNLRNTATGFARRGECDKLEVFRNRQPPDVQRAIGNPECTPKSTNTGSAGSGSNTQVTVPPPSCAPADVAAHRAAAQTAYNQGNYTSSLAEYDAVLKCSPDDASDPRVYAAACAAHAFPRAKQLFVKLMGDKDHLAQICLNYGFDPRKP